MVEPLEDAYFRWLYALVCNPMEKDPNSRYEHLLGLLFHTEFVWGVVGDDNRAEDGVDLRDGFIILYPEASFEDTPCSVLEMLIAFSRKAAFDTDVDEKRWFWKMLENLGLSSYSDAVEIDDNHVAGVLDTFVYRRYNQFGHGGIFPLRESEYDQRYIEILYQFSEYLYQNNIA